MNTHSRKASKNFHLLNHHTHRFVDSGTPLYFYSVTNLRVNFATFWSCSFLLFVMCKGWHDNISVWATARIVPGFAQHTSWSGHYIYMQQHFARRDTQAVLMVTPAGLPTHHHISVSGCSQINVKAANLPPQLFHIKYIHME